MGGIRNVGMKRPQLTHFLCLPLVNETSESQLERGLTSFRQDVSEVPDKAIRPLGAIHCTLGVMSLASRELELAVKILSELDVLNLLKHNSSEEAQEQALSSTSAPICIDLKGLESMHEPRNTSILYIAPRDPTNRLLTFCLSVQAAFKAQGLLVADDRPLKLHATIVNTIYAKGFMPQRRATAQSSSSELQATGEGEIAAIASTTDGFTGHGPKARGSAKIDAREILTRYHDFAWANNVTLDRIAICEMGAKKRFDDTGRLISEEYTEVAHITLPTS